MHSKFHLWKENVSFHILRHTELRLSSSVIYSETLCIPKWFHVSPDISLEFAQIYSSYVSGEEKHRWKFSRLNLCKHRILHSIWTKTHRQWDDMVLFQEAFNTRFVIMYKRDPLNLVKAVIGNELTRKAESSCIFWKDWL